MAAPFPRGSPQVEQSFFPLTDLGDKHDFKKTEEQLMLKRSQMFTQVYREGQDGRKKHWGVSDKIHIDPSAMLLNQPACLPCRQASRELKMLECTAAQTHFPASLLC